MIYVFYVVCFVFGWFNGDGYYSIKDFAWWRNFFFFFVAYGFGLAIGAGKQKMPNFKTGNMWDAWDTADLFLITTNAVLKYNNELVMGRGIALEARRRDPQIALYFGRALSDAQKGDKSLTLYGLIIPNLWPLRIEGMFQTKRHWRDFADIGIIRASTSMLEAWCTAFPNQQVHLNYPGIGNGRLDAAVVEPIIAVLPDSVTIWSKEQN